MTGKVMASAEAARKPPAASVPRFGATSSLSRAAGPLADEGKRLPELPPAFNFHQLPIQTKLTVGPAGDAFEVEADRTAERVMRMAEPGAAAVDDEDEKELKREKREELQRKPAGGAVAETAAPTVVHEVLRAPGVPLDAGTRAFMEPRFGYDFSKVRVHADARADAAARSVEALAFTAGNDIVFRAHAPASATDTGRRLLAHELTHVVQQSGGTRTARARSGASRPDHPAEQQAPSVAGAIAVGSPAAVSAQPVAGLQRQPATGGVLDPWSNLKRQLGGGTPMTGAPLVLQGPTSQLPEVKAPEEPVFTESARPASYRVRVVAHASPRWRAAADAKEADRLNLDLSRRRAEAVGFEVEKRLAKLLPAGSTVSVGASADLKEDTVGVEQEAHGSQDTLKEAHGNRKDNARGRRRVDIYVSSNQDVTATGRASKQMIYRPTASEFWHVGVNLSASAGEGTSVGLLEVALTQDSTGETMTGHVVGLVKGVDGPFPATVAISFSDATGFKTVKPVDFKDFRNTLVTYDSFGINFFFGYSQSYVHFPLVSTEPGEINVSGATGGVPGIDVTHMTGVFNFDGEPSFPSRMVPIEGTDETESTGTRADKGEDQFTVFLETGSDQMDGTEADLLDSFLASVVAARR